MLTLFFFWWLISFPWKAANQSPSEKALCEESGKEGDDTLCHGGGDEMSLCSLVPIETLP